jgi:DNA helicase HerA-like ATPase
VALSGWCHSILEELQPEGLPNVHEDDPIACDVSLLRRLIEEVAAAEGQRAASWAAPLLFRFDALLGDPRIRQIAFDQSLGETLEEFLDQLMPNRGIVIVDLSLVPASVVHVVVGVIARIIFESHERARRHGLAPVPTLLVAEEAHTFITRRARRDDDLPPLPVDVCRTAFERIAREGRKHGVSLVVTSQRPSELSETVLSQCNTFLVHRVVNDVDQNLIRRLTPDAISGLLDELPSLPARSAFLLGWAVPVPVLVKMEEVPPEYRPHSEDPDLRAAWSSEPTANWTEVASEWATTTGPSDESVGADDEAPW